MAQVHGGAGGIGRIGQWRDGHRPSGKLVLGSGRVAWNGTVTINSRITLAAGRHALTLSFGGTATTGAKSVGSVLNVGR